MARESHTNRGNTAIRALLDGLPDDIAACAERDLPVVFHCDAPPRQHVRQLMATLGVEVRVRGVTLAPDTVVKLCKYECGRPAAWSRGRLAGVCVECEPIADEHFREARAKTLAARPSGGGKRMTALPGLRPDPPVRADGRCVVCMKPRKPERSAKYVPGEAERDPFCSNPCARKWHDNDLRPDSIWSLEPVEKEVA